jgi:hypothetical protein
MLAKFLIRLRTFWHFQWTLMTGRFGAGYDSDYLNMVMGHPGGGTILQFSTVRPGTHVAFGDIKRELTRMMRHGLCGCSDMSEHKYNKDMLYYAVTKYYITPKGLAKWLKKQNFNAWVFGNHGLLIMSDLL